MYADHGQQKTHSTERNIEADKALFVAPGEKGFEGVCVVFGLLREGRVPYTDDSLEHGNVHLYIHVPRHSPKLGLITLQGLFGNEKCGKGFLDDCAHYKLDFSHKTSRLIS